MPDYSADLVDPELEQLIAGLEAHMFRLPLWKGGPDGPTAFMAKRPDGWTLLLTIRDDLALFVTRETASQFVEMLQRDLAARRERDQAIVREEARRAALPPAEIAREDAERRLREHAITLQTLLHDIGHLARSARLPAAALVEILSLPAWYRRYVFAGFDRDRMAGERDGPAGDP